ncbi:hypothetical protein ABZ553_30030 [Streptomyces sparsogenes]|uniref:hypothetical protein n=1 Tax=Streptomyces sparsogenes TaxID=67365 RepID=UPI0033E57812
MRQKKDPTTHPDYRHPDMKRVQATRKAIAEAERRLAKLREQLDDDVRAAMTPPAGEKLPYGRVKRLQLLFGYEDNSNLYRMRDRSTQRAEKSLAGNSGKDDDAKPSVGDEENVNPAQVKLAAA